MQFSRVANEKGEILLHIPVWNPVKNEIILDRYPQGSQSDTEINVTTFVGITGVSFIEGRPAQRVLGDMANIVEQIITAMENKATEIGFFSHSK